MEIKIGNKAALKGQEEAIVRAMIETHVAIASQRAMLDHLVEALNSEPEASRLMQHRTLSLPSTGIATRAVEGWARARFPELDIRIEAPGDLCGSGD